VDVHLPKPLHGWREFVGEVGIIVLGVLIALGAEQVAETIHGLVEAKYARQAIRKQSLVLADRTDLRSVAHRRRT
jgi:isocitrate dehydrogenase